ncbi:MAG: hypothetical protein JXQ83_10715, partial [Candidatus Glassbacteria bacterium]|nr:hypothetical protein [Candidatus Glassbacteria bacterium]
MFSHYLKVAIRNLLRHKVYSAINIAGLAVGLASGLVLSRVDHPLLDFTLTEPDVGRYPIRLFRA